MAEHVLKYPVDADVSEQVLLLFGKVANAQRLLRVEHVPYHIMSAALKGNPVPSNYADDIVAAWRFWKQLYIRGFRSGVNVEPEPSWRLPDGSEAVAARLEELNDLEHAEWKRRAKKK